MTVMTMASATIQGAERIAELLARAKRIAEDADRDERLAHGQCKACFYGRGSRLTAAAMTRTACMCCQTEMTFGSSSIDVLCKPCASRHQLCSHCGADVNLEMRESWPTAESVPTKGDDRG
jgi:hypothetical protein